MPTTRQIVTALIVADQALQEMQTNAELAGNSTISPAGNARWLTSRAIDRVEFCTPLDVIVFTHVDVNGKVTHTVSSSWIETVEKLKTQLEMDLEDKSLIRHALARTNLSDNVLAKYDAHYLMQLTQALQPAMFKNCCPRRYHLSVETVFAENIEKIV